MTTMTFSSAAALTGSFDELPAYYGAAIKPRVAAIMRRTSTTAQEHAQTSQSRTEKETAIEAALQNVIDDLKTSAPAAAPQDEIIDLTPDMIVDPRSPLFPALLRNLHFSMPTKAQIANARHCVARWVRMNAPMLFATSTAGFVMGQNSARLVAQFNLNSLMATVPGFTPALAAGALTGAVIGLVAEAMRPTASTHAPKTKRTFLAAAGNGAARTTSIVSMGPFGPAVVEAAKSGVKFIAASVPNLFARKKKEPQAFDKKGFAIRLGLSLVSGGLSALLGYHLRSHAAALVAPDAAVEHPQQPAEHLTQTHEIARERALAVHEVTQNVKPVAPEAGKAAAIPDPVQSSEIDRERLIAKNEPVQTEPEKVVDPVAPLPEIKMPAMLKGLLTADQFHSLSRELQTMAVTANRTHNPETFMHLAKEASHQLLMQGKASSSKAASNLITDALTVAWKNGLLETETGRKLNADIAYLLATGKGGMQQDFNKAAYHMLLGGKGKVVSDVQSILEAKAPSTLQVARADFQRFRTQDLGLT